MPTTAGLSHTCNSKQAPVRASEERRPGPGTGVAGVTADGEHCSGPNPRDREARRARLQVWHLLQNLLDEKKVVFIKSINIHAAW